MKNESRPDGRVTLRQSARRITRTAVLLALLIVLQTMTKPLGQFVTGSCVNLVLGVAALVGGVWCGVAVALLSPLFAFLLGIGPAFLQLVPMIAAGNAVFVLLLHAMGRTDAGKRWLGAAAGAAAKALTLYLLIVKLALPLLGLPEKQTALLSASFAWPQLVTALIGGALAAALYPVLKKALRSA